MMLSNVVVTSFLTYMTILNCIYCDNTTSSVLGPWGHPGYTSKPAKRVFKDGGDKKRKGRIIAFNVDDDSNVTVELGFNVPFLKVPVGANRGRRGSGNDPEAKPKPMVEINAGGVIVAGVLAATVLFIVPNILKNPPTVTRSDSEKEGMIWKSIKEFDTVLAENKIDSSACAQKTMCWVAQNTKDGTLGNIVNSISNSWIVSTFMSGTPLQKALSTDDCSETYPSCPVSRHHIDSLAESWVSRFST